MVIGIIQLFKQSPKMKVGDEIDLPHHLRDINFTRIGGLRAKVLEVREDTVKLQLLVIKTIVTIRKQHDFDEI